MPHCPENRSTVALMAALALVQAGLAAGQDAQPSVPPEIRPLVVPSPLFPLEDSPLPAPIVPPPQRMSLADRLLGGPRRTVSRTLTPVALSAPNMFGDTTSGACGEAAFLSGTVTAGFEHPTFNCTRANLAENNSPLPRSRVYVRYNHFHNINQVAIFPDTLPEGINQLHIDRVTFGAEAAFLDDRFSFETRVAIARQLTSDVVLYDYQGDYNLPLDDYRTELLNLNFILKGILVERENFVVSGGMGINVPTAQDVHIRILVDDDNFEIIVPGIGHVGYLDVKADISGRVQNSTVNLAPFLASLWTPTPRLFMQGFAQVVVPLNVSKTVVSGTIGEPGPDQIVIPPDAGALHQQTLMRINAGGGYWVWQRPERKFLQGVAGILELHYTTALNDADRNPFSIAVLPLPGPLPSLEADVVVGNLANRVDLLNMTAGTHFQLGERTSLGVGFVVPLRQGVGDKPFDFELNVLLNHML